MKKLIKKILNEDINNKIKSLQNQLHNLEVIKLDELRKSGKSDSKEWNDTVDDIKKIRKQLYNLTGDPYGKTNKEKNNTKPNGLYDNYDNPYDVPVDVYKWINQNSSLLSSDATDAVRWSRIVNTKNEDRYPNEDITIYRAVNDPNTESIREGDWVTTDEKYAIQHNNRYFDGNGKVISMSVNGNDVLVSPTGNYEEAIYAPLKYSINVKL